MKRKACDMIKEDASNKYHKKAGYISKHYLFTPDKRTVIEEFEMTCDNDGVSRSAKVVELMGEYVKHHRNSQESGG